MLGLGQDPTEDPTTALGVLVFGWAKFKQKSSAASAVVRGFVLRCAANPCAATHAGVDTRFARPTGRLLERRRSGVSACLRSRCSLWFNPGYCLKACCRAHYQYEKPFES
jgi:hypothetical protein